jgi:Holliday junction resolvasome RuvABC endonuclease subunit
MYTRIDPDDILQRIREKIAEGRTRKVAPTFRPPTAADFRIESQILAFDQTLSNCGWALVNTEGGKVTVPESGTIKPPTLNGQKGFEATLAKAVPLASRIQHVLNMQYSRFEEVVLELPAVVGYRTESSLIAAVMICVELDRMGCKQPEFVSRQAAGTVLVGDRHASKTESSRFVNDLITEHPTGTGCWTEHVRDAVFVGAKYLYVEGK